MYRSHPSPLSFPGVRTALQAAVLLLLFAASAESQGTAARVRPADPAERGSSGPAESPVQRQQRLARLVKETGLDVSGEKDWVVQFKGRNLQPVTVYLRVHEDLALIQSQTISPATAASDRLKDLLKLSFDTDLAKLGITEDKVVALSEVELKSLDGSLLRRLIESVASLADDAYGMLAPAPATESATYSPLVSPRSGSATTKLDLLRGNASLTFDSTGWSQFNNPGEPSDIMQYRDDNTELFFKVIAERIQVPLENLEAINLKQMKNFDAQARVAKRGWRTVNGQRLLVLEFEASSEGIQFTFLGHYFSSEAGTIQIVAWTSRNLLAEKRPLIDAIVAGFHAKK